MSGSDRRELAKVIGIGLAGLVAFASILFLGYGLGSSAAYFDAQADSYAAQYPSDTDRRIEECFREALPPECIEQAIEASHESQRAEQDLSAQRQMADWAFWLLVVSVAQIPIGIAGLLALIETIRQGRQALDHARSASDTQLRAYVYHRKVEIVDDGPHKYRVQTLFLNGGQTPARDVASGLDVRYLPYPIDAAKVPAVVKRAEPNFSMIAPGAERKSWVRVTLNAEQEIKIAKREACIIARVYVSYRTQNGSTVTEPLTEVIAVGARWGDDAMRLLNRHRDFKNDAEKRA